MKNYSLKINGQNYTVQIDEVNDASTVAHVVVNGTAYEVEIEGAKTSAASRPRWCRSQGSQQCHDYPCDGFAFAPASPLRPPRRVTP